MFRPFICAYILSFLSVCLVTWKIKSFFKQDCGKDLFLFILALGEWVFFVMVLEMISSAKWQVILSSFGYAGFAMSPVFLLLFAIRYAGILKEHKRKLLIFFSIIPFFTTIGAFTNHFHHLLWPAFSVAENGILIFNHGPLFYINAFYCFMCVCTTLAVFFTIIVQNRNTNNIGTILLAGLLLPWWAGILYVAGWNPFLGEDIITITAGFSSLFLIPAVRYAVKPIVTLQKQSVHNVSSIETNDAELANRIMLLVIQLWKKKTGKTRIEFAQQSGLWKIHIDANGWQRTQTLDKYLDVQKVPKNPRWKTIIESAEYVIALGCCDDQLEKELKNLLHSPSLRL
jgi:hypothetical protein